MAKRLRVTALALAIAAVLALPAAAYGDTDGHWAIDYIDDATQRGLFAGVDETHFAPEQEMSRAMAVTVLWRLAGKPAYESPHGFPDAQTEGWYAAPLRWAKRCGIANGDDSGLFRPDDSITREELAALLMRFLMNEQSVHFEGRMNTPEFYHASFIDHATTHFSDADKCSLWAASALGWAIETGVLKGDSEGTLRPADTLTRAEAAAMFCRVVELYYQ